MSNSLYTWIKVQNKHTNHIEYVHLPTLRVTQYILIDDMTKVDPNIWTEKKDTSGKVISYVCEETHEEIYLDKLSIRRRSSDLALSDIKENRSTIDASTDILSPSLRSRGYEQTINHSDASSYVRSMTLSQAQSMNNSTYINSYSHSAPLGPPPSISSILHPNRPSNISNDLNNDDSIKEHSHQIAVAISNRVHPRSLYVTHSNWYFTLNLGNGFVLYYQPKTGEISSVLPDGFPYSDEDLLCNSVIHQSSFFSTSDVCTVNLMFGHIRASLEVRRGNRRLSTSSFISSSYFWRTSESSAGRSRSSIDLTNSISNLLPEEVNRTISSNDNHNSDVTSNAPINDDEVTLSDDSISSDSSTGNKQTNRRTSDSTGLGLPICSSALSSSSDINYGMTMTYPYLAELRNILFSPDDPEIPPTLRVLTENVFKDNSAIIRHHYKKTGIYAVSVFYCFHKYTELRVEKRSITLIGRQRVDSNLEEITDLKVIDKKGRVVSKDFDNCTGIQLFFREPDNSSLYDAVINKPMKPMKIYFQSVKDRKDFMLIYYNFKRMYHENRVHHGLYAGYRNDTKKGIVSWVIADVDINHVLPCKLKWQLPQARLDTGRIMITSREDEKLQVIEIEDIMGILIGKHAANDVCTCHLLLVNKKRKTFAFNSEVERREFLELAQITLGDNIIKNEVRLRR